jgi:hypothetical protein
MLNSKTNEIMTTLEQIKFAAQIQVGTRIKAGKQIMVVTEITAKRIKGYSEYAKSNGYESDMFLSFETITNPHYNKNFEILK